MLVVFVRHHVQGHLWDKGVCRLAPPLTSDRCLTESMFDFGNTLGFSASRRLLGRLCIVTFDDPYLMKKTVGETRVPRAARGPRECVLEALNCVDFRFESSFWNCRPDVERLLSTRFLLKGPSRWCFTGK